MNIKERLQQQLGKEISQSSNSEIYNGLLNITQQLADEKESILPWKKMRPSKKATMERKKFTIFQQNFLLENCFQTT